jgi:uncharacterized repeat protein (TIGR01451 family)
MNTKKLQHISLALTLSLLALVGVLALVGTWDSGPSPPTWLRASVAQAQASSRLPAALLTSTTVFTEGFEISVPPPGWIEEDVSGTAGNWARSSDTVHPSGGGVHGGSYLAYFNSYNAPSGSSTRIYTTNLDFSTAGDYHISLWMYHDTGQAGINDRVQIEVDDGSGWTNVGSAISRYDGATGWAQHTVDLSAYAGDVISLSIKGISGYGNDVHIDDVHVYRQPPTPHLNVTKMATTDSLSVAPGENVTYSIAITNSGLVTAPDTVLTDTLDVYQRPQNVTTSLGSCTIAGGGWGGVVTCTLGDLGGGATAHVTLTAQTTGTLPAQGYQRIANTVEVAAPGASASAQTSLWLDLCRVRLVEGVTATPYNALQEAIDAATSPTATVQVAGTCHNVENLAQIAYIGKRITLRGGYNPDFSTWDPDLYPTTLDAQGSHRVVYIDAATGATVEHLRITGGDAGSSDGGGIWIRSSDATIRSCQILTNTARYGGGVYVHDSNSNPHNVTLMGNTIRGNVAQNEGGGVRALQNSTLLKDNIIQGNTAPEGGGLYFYDCWRPTLKGNVVQDNTAQQRGGGVYLDNSRRAILESNVIRNNTAQQQGGGLYFYMTSEGDITPILINNVLADNRANGEGSALYIWRTYGDYHSTTLLHTTLARNEGNSGVYVDGDSEVIFKNTIVYSHTTGVHNNGGVVSMTLTLWQSNTTDYAGTVDTIGHLTGTVAFAADGYHLTAASDAIDRGVDAGVTDDVDGQTRPMGPFPDLGADEYPYQADLSLSKVRQGSGPANAGEPISYTLSGHSGTGLGRGRAERQHAGRRLHGRRSRRHLHPLQCRYRYRALNDHLGHHHRHLRRRAHQYRHRHPHQCY